MIRMHLIRFVTFLLFFIVSIVGNQCLTFIFVGHVLIVGFTAIPSIGDNIFRQVLERVLHRIEKRIERACIGWIPINIVSQYKLIIGRNL